MLPKCLNFFFFDGFTHDLLEPYFSLQQKQFLKSFTTSPKISPSCFSLSFFFFSCHIIALHACTCVYSHTCYILEQLKILLVSYQAFPILFFFFFCICGQLIIKKIVFGTCIVSLISELSDNNSFAVYHILNIPLLLLQLLSGATLLGAMFCFSAFCFKSLYGFVALFSVGEILVFATQVSLSWYELVKNLI
jgi:hypothetical protein